MPNFDIHLLATADGSWDRFRSDWEKQCAEVGDILDEYAPEALGVLAETVAGTIKPVAPTSTTHVGALWDNASGRYYACCLLNRAMIPGVDGYTLRIRHLLVSPLLDYGVGEVALYPDVLVGILSGVVHMSSTELQAQHIRMHLRSPEDQAFFHTLGTNLDGSGVFESVQTHGMWLYIYLKSPVATGSVGA